MYELSRIRLFSVGPAGARYEDVTIDLSQAGKPVQRRQLSLLDVPEVLRPSPATVLFLENGGGKSVLIKLIFSVMLPGKRQIVGTSNTRVLEKFVERGDIAHVILEWMHMETGRLLVTGKVSEWRARRNNSDEGMSETWYSFRPGASVGISSLPVTENGQKLVAAAFREKLTELSEQDSSLELFWADRHHKWEERLEGLGLDPQLFDFQRRMNSGEGEAADAFTFATDESLVEFLLKAVLPEPDAASLGESLAGYAKNLAERDTLALEHDFIVAVLEHLEPLAEQHNEAQAAQQVLAEREAERNEHLASVAARIDQERIELEVRQSRLTAAQIALGGARGRAAIAKAVMGELARRIAELRQENAHAVYRAADQVSKEAADLVLGWAAVSPLLDWSAKHEAHEQLKTTLQGQQNLAAAAVRTRDYRAGELVHALLAMTSEAEREAEARDLVADTCIENARSAQEGHDKAVTAGATARAQWNSLTNMVAGVEADVDIAVRDRLIPDARSVSASAEALATAAVTANSAVSEQERQIAVLDSRIDRTQAELNSARDEQAVAKAEYDKSDSAVVRAEAEMSALGGSSRLRELLGSSEVVLETDAETLIQRLIEALGAFDRNRLDLRAAGAADDRARLFLDSDDDALYPPPVEIEKLVDLLKSENIRCYSGWDVLADIPDIETRNALVDRLPHLASGVLLNNPDDCERARHLVCVAGHDPTFLIAVATTQSFDLEPVAEFDLVPHVGAGFIVPPHRALYDHEAARTERALINQRHLEREERIAELGKRHGVDVDLKIGLTRWRAEYPPGKYADLLGWRSASLDTLAAKQKAVREGLGAFDEAKRLRVEARKQLDGLRETARIANDRADLVAKLRQRVIDAGAWQLAAKQASEEALAADSRADTLRKRRDDQQDQARVQRRLADLQRANISRLNEEVTLAGGAEIARPSETGPPQPIPVLRQLLAEASDACTRAEIGSDLLGEVEKAGSAADQAKGVLDQHSADARRRAKILLSSPDGADAAGRESAMALARDREYSARATRDETMQEWSMHRARYDDLPVLATPVDLPEVPRDIDHAEQLLLTQGSAHKTAEAAVDSCEGDCFAISASLEGIHDGLKGFQRVTDALEVADEFDWEPVAPIATPYGGSPNEALAQYKELTKLVRGARDRRNAAQRQAAQTVELLRATMSATRFNAVLSAVRAQITTVPAGAIPAHSEAWLTALKPRLRSLSADLAESERHRVIIIARLQSMVENAYRTLRQAQRLSRLPAGLGDWSGEEFLRISVKPCEGEVLNHRLAEVIDAAAREQSRRDGMAILLRGVRAAAAPQGFKVTMLKPDAVLRAERVRVSEVRDVFSGGQHLTAAIMLYCTLAALRANLRGHSGQRHSGVLFLDNPIGRASAGYLLDLQRSVAAALGVQLVYTTGLFDAEALGAFPLIVRLRNDADLRAGRKYLAVDQSVRAKLDVLPDPDGTASVSASRVLLRESHRDQK